jgi:hypothetical protein
MAAEPNALSQKAACRLAGRERVSGGATYSIAGTYFADGMHGASMDLPECDTTIFPMMIGQAEAQIAAYHQAFRQKCGATLMGDYVIGVFTGRFSARTARRFGMRSPMMTDFFVISKIDTRSLDIASITCSS